MAGEFLSRNRLGLALGPGYRNHRDAACQITRVETNTHRIGKIDYQVRALSDRQQYSDPDGEAERAGVTAASWPLFGVLCPAGVALAEAMCVIPIAGRRILEVGCGLGLASLVLQRRGADITASDHHPLAGAFMRHNTDLNRLAPIPFCQASWGGPDPGIGRFDLLIGADVLYEYEHPRLLAAFIALHANPTAQFVMTDAGRGHCGRFSARVRPLRLESHRCPRGACCCVDFAAIIPYIEWHVELPDTG